MSFKSSHLDSGLVVASCSMLCSIEAAHIHLVSPIHHNEHLLIISPYLIFASILRDAPEFRRSKRLAISAESSAWLALENYLVFIGDFSKHS